MLRDEVDRAIAHLGLTVQELRDLAAGLQPAALAGGGLRAAVEDLRGRLPLRMTLEVIDRRFSPAVEGAAWFVIADNAVKHSQVDEVAIAVSAAAGRLRVTITDAGWAPTPMAAGSRDWPTAFPPWGWFAVSRSEPTPRHPGGGVAAVRVVIADDSALLREGLARLLQESGVEVCETASDAAGLVETVVRTEPDVAIIDIRMPPTYTHEGAAAAIELRERMPHLGVLLHSQAVETHFASQLLEQHSERFGYLLKDRVIDVVTLTNALRTIAAGGTVLDPEIVRHLMRRDSAADPLAALTDREREVLALMAEGRSNSAISDRLTVTPKTVESHIANIFSKLGLHGAQDDHRRVLAVLAALRPGDAS